ncbi:MAG TPA: hypothetical protein VFD48_12870 [Pyrinomonadaceae bacterium]|nr:hypothetical protein [Pyrinomonadaceae bacterium]
MEEVQRYIVNPSLQLASLDLSGSESRYLVQVDEVRFEVSERIHQIIQFLQLGIETAEGIAQELRKSGLPQASADGIAAVMRQTLIPRNIVRNSKDEFATTAVRAKRSHLSLQLPIVHPDTIRPLTGVLQLFFHKRIFIAMLLIAAVAHIYFYTLVLPEFQWSLTTLSPVDYLFILLVLNFTTILHELGHASACRFYNCPHGKIGWGIYLYMLVFYTDVTPTWKLKRKQRALVDVGGMYFELIASVLVLALLLLTPSSLFVYVFVLLDLSILYSFNPILKRDGYWLITDLAGVTNLRDLSIEALRFLMTKTLKRSSLPPSRRLLALPKKVRVALYAYTVVSLTFFFGLTYWLSTQIIREIIPGYPRGLKSLREALNKLPVDYYGALSASMRLAILTLLVALLGFALIRILRFAYRAVKTVAGADIAAAPI